MSAITTIARAFRGGLSPKPARAYIVPLDIHSNDDPLIDLRRSFQYFPATISDSHATNYQAKVIPGLSHPLYQWTSGGARTISFEAIFTRDRTYNRAERDAIFQEGLTNASVSAGAGSTRNTNPKSLGVSSNKEPRDVDIPSAIAWLRSFLLPEYSTDGKGTFSATPSRPRPPRKLILGLPGVRINWGMPALPAYETYCIMTGCEVTYEAFFHDGSPRMARLAMTFVEIIQIGGRIIVQDAGNRRISGYGGYLLNEEGNNDDGGGLF